MKMQRAPIHKDIDSRVPEHIGLNWGFKYSVHEIMKIILFDIYILLDNFF